MKDKDDDIKYLSLEVLDMEDQNILKHFDPAFKYIERGRYGGAVLVHWYAETFSVSRNSFRPFLASYPDVSPCFPAATLECPVRQLFASLTS